MKSLRDKLQDSLRKGYADSGFPIVRRENDGLRAVGYIGVNELEHALGERVSFQELPSLLLIKPYIYQQLRRTTPMRLARSTASPRLLVGVQSQPHHLLMKQSRTPSTLQCTRTR